MKILLSIAAAGSCVLALACGRPPKLALGKPDAAMRGPATSSVLRIPEAGGTARLYRVPSLDPSSWTAEDKIPPVERMIGSDPEQGLVFALDKKRNLVVLDLETRRVRTYLEQVRAATVGPDGAVYAVDTGSTVTQMVRRAPVRFRSKLQGDPHALYATMSGAVVARVGDKAPVMEVLGSDQPPVSTTLPAERIAPSFYGDLVAVATDTAVVLYETQGKGKPRTIHVRGHPRAVAFSPSGHRLYVVTQDDDELVVLDRFSGERLESHDLPGPPKGMRGDRFGQWLLIQPEHGDSVWVFDVGRGKFSGAVPARWGTDLPVVASPGALVARSGEDVVSLDLGRAGFPEVGRVQGGAADTWLAIAWRPSRDVQEASPTDSTALAAADTSDKPSVYLQVSSSQNPAWANELADKLRAAGLPASVLAPAKGDEAHRVVLGPYATREQAEETGRKIGMPSFIVSAQDAPDH